jgi:L-asparaginase/Glu-tRNA(Gln) amidotransferase subunit D
MGRPVIAILALGGTIAAAPPEPGRAATMDHDADVIVRSVPALAAVADTRPESFRRIGSADLGFADIRKRRASCSTGWSFRTCRWW